MINVEIFSRYLPTDLDGSGKVTCDFFDDCDGFSQEIGNALNKKKKVKILLVRQSHYDGMMFVTIFSETED